MKAATFDLEADGLLPEASRVWCAVVKDHRTKELEVFTPDNVDSLAAHLDTYDVLIGHNCIRYDFPLLRKIYGWEFKGKKVDTLLMSQLQRPNRQAPKDCPTNKPHSVEAWGWRFGYKKIEHEEWDKFSKEMLERCKKDVEIQYMIYNALREEGKGEQWAAAHKLNMQLFHYLQLQEEYGWAIDRDHLENSIKLLDKWIDRIDRALIHHLPLIVDKLETRNGYEYNYVKKPFKANGQLSAVTLRSMGRMGLDRDRFAVGGPFSRISIRPISLDSNLEVKNFLLDQGWKPATYNTNDKGEVTSPKLSKDDPFEGIQGSLGRLVVKRIQCRQRRSVLEGWQENIRPDGRISTKVNGIASTGRIKHSTVVNVPSPHSKALFAKQMRQCFIPREGWIMVGADSSGNQMRQLAARMRAGGYPDEEFEYAVLHGSKEDGTDLHTLNQRRSGAASRNLSKNFFYGCILFGAGDSKTAKILNTNKKRAAEIKEEYFREMPGLRQVLNDLTNEWKETAQKYWDSKFNKMVYKNGYITGVDGRPILVKSEHALLAYALQSDEAIQMAVAYVMIHKWARKKEWEIGRDWGMLIWMHDEVQMECRPEIADELGELACYAIKWAGEFLGIQCPHDGGYEKGYSWYETH